MGSDGEAAGRSGPDVRSLPPVFEVSDSVRVERLDRQIAGLGRLLQRRIDSLEEARTEAAGLRDANAALEREVASLRATIDGLEQELAGAQEARAEYHRLLATRSVRWLHGPRLAYARARRVSGAVVHRLPGLDQPG